MAVFHHRCGVRITLSNNNLTANRNTGFNHGLVLSSEPLNDNELFEVKIDRKIYSWSGSIEIGVTTCDPETMVFPTVATDLREGSWVLAGHSVLKDGRSILDEYSVDLEKISEGDRVGVLRTSEGELVFYVNGLSHGVAADSIPSRVFAVVDLYGKVDQVTVISPHLPVASAPPPAISGEVITGSAEEEAADLQATVTDLVASLDVDMTVQNGANMPAERLRFHPRTGSLVKLSYNARTAERLRPLDEFNNGVVMTHRPLQDNQLFEIRIDRLVEKWSGSIEVGVTTHNPAALEFPATMTNMRSGTTMMSGCGILTNGKGTRREYGEFNLDELRVGDRIGMMRKANGNLHYFINGLDQGVAATRVPAVVWGVVDLYGMTVKVTIVDRDEREEQNLITRRNTALRDQQVTQALNDIPDEDVIDRLMFHSNCGTHAAVINNSRTAHRPNAMDDFNNGVVLTHRPLKPNELFEVRLDKMVTKWAGSIEIGVTTHSPTELEYPSTMTNVRSGTWMMTGNGVMHNGTTVIDEYGQNLDRLQVGDRVGVILKESGSLHFLVNGIDQGEAATNIPPRVYGVIDLYGQAAQATILDYNCQCCCSPSTDTIHDALPALHSSARQHFHADLHFHHVHGRNARVSNGGRTASRPRALGEFNDAIVMSNRSLRDDEMFAVVIEKIVDRWSGSIEAGVTAIRPDELDLPGTMTDLDHDTWMLSGSAVMRDGMTLRHGYALDLDTVSTGAVIGMKRHRDGSLHYYLDGVDQGEACSGLPPNVYPVIDLYGQCAQVSIVSPVERQIEPESNENSCSQYLPRRLDEPSAISASSTTHQPSANLILHRLSPWCGKNMTLQAGNVTAIRTAGQHNNGLVLSATPLTSGELFEVAVDKWTGQWAGSLAVGVTLGTPADRNPLPPTIAGFKVDTWYVQGDEVFHNGRLLRSHYCRSLDWLRIGDRVGVRRCNDGTLHFYINGCDQGAAAQNIPKRIYVVVDCYGSVSGVRVTSKLLAHPLSESQGGDSAVAGAVALNTDQEGAAEEEATVKRWDDSSALRELSRNEDIGEKRKQNSIDIDLIDDSDLEIMDDIQGDCTEFHEVHGRNVQLSENRIIAKRIASYNQGLVLTRRHLPRGFLFQVRIEGINPRWVSSLCVGVTTHVFGNSALPVTALGLKRDTWLICSDSVFHNGHKVKCKYGPNLDTLGIGHTVGVMLDCENQLRLYVDDVDQGVAASDVSVPCRVVLDLYGQCEQVSVVKPHSENVQMTAPIDVPLSVCKDVVDVDRLVDSRISVEETEIINDVVDFSAQEKADLESHEKESPTGSECGGIAVREDPMRVKSDKTNENIQVEMLTSASSVGVVGCVTDNVVGGESDEEEYELDPKSIASNENLTLQQFEQQQNAEISRHIAETNCDHKTSLNLANTSYVKSPSSSSMKPLVTRSLENSLASSLPTPLISPSAAIKTNLDCEYLNSCMRLKTALGLPGGFFNIPAAVCYCETCWSPSKITDLPLNSVPFGWLHLPLRRRNFDAVMAGSATDQWHTAFFGTSLGTIRKILDLGELFTPGELGLAQNVHRKLHSKQDDCDASQLVLSPSIQYIINSKHPFLDPKTQKQMVAYAAFQVLVRPGSYKVVTSGSVVASTPAQFDLNTISVDASEWVTKERNATVITALLLKLVPT